MFGPKLLIPLRRWRARMLERRELGALSDRALADIGMTRADAVCAVEGTCYAGHRVDQR